MSYLVPAARTRSDGTHVPALTPDEKRQAQDYLDRLRIARGAQDIYYDFFNWRRLTEDVIHYRPIDSLTNEEQLAIRYRRQKAFEESYIPWIASDTAALLTGIDDIDDMIKTARFVNRYAVLPASTRELFPSLPTAWFRNPHLNSWRRQCAKRLPKHGRKLAYLDDITPNRFTDNTTPFFRGLFPSWGFWGLAIQALQTIDGLFGVGLQLGPVVGTAMELVFRGLASLGLPFSPADNKYHQLLAARTNSEAPRLLAAHSALHPEDLFSTLHGLRLATGEDVLPPMVITPDQYPNAFDMAQHPWQQINNFANLAASIPYNVVGGIVNNLIAPPLIHWSTNIENTTETEFPHPELDNFPAWVMRAIAKGLCPGPMCDAELYQALVFLANARRRVLPTPLKYPDPDLTVADRFQFVIDYILPQILGPGTL